MKGNFYKSPIGTFLLIEDEVGIKEISLLKDESIFNNIEISNSYNLNLSIKEFEEYFQGKRKNFTFKLSVEGTEFQKLVWNELTKIPYGETKSYGEIAININKEKASRAVGNANNKNKLPIVIPCHRVIGKSGSLVGYALGLEIKKFLLELERKNLTK